MTDLSTIADGVTRWTSLGVELPKELAEAVKVYEALRYTEVGHQPVFDLAAVTTANAEKKIREFADQLALSETPAGGQSVLAKAKGYAADAAARGVLSSARAAVPEVINRLTPEFDQHAEAYAAAVETLPEEITSDALLSAGPEAVADYQDAQREAQYLNTISTWVATTSYLSGMTPKNIESVIRILRPASPGELVELDAAHHKSANPVLAAIDPVLFAAARHHIEFKINTLAECADLRAELERAAADSVRFS